MNHRQARSYSELGLTLKQVRFTVLHIRSSRCVLAHTCFLGFGGSCCRAVAEVCARGPRVERLHETCKQGQPVSGNWWKKHQVVVWCGVVVACGALMVGHCLFHRFLRYPNIVQRSTRTECPYLSNCSTHPTAALRLDDWSRRCST